MARFKWLWIALATLGATALLMLLLTVVAGLAARVLPFLSQYSGSDRLFGFWVSIVPGAGGVVWMVAASLHQMRVHRSRSDVPRLPRARPAFWLFALVLTATIATLFTLSARLGFTAMHIADDELRAATLRFGSILFAPAGAGLLVVLACAHRMHRRVHAPGGRLALTDLHLQ